MTDDDNPFSKIVDFDEAMRRQREDDPELRSLAASFIQLLVIDAPDEDDLTRLAEIANSLAMTQAATIAGVRYKLTAILGHVLAQLGEDDLSADLLTSAMGDLGAFDGDRGGRGRKGAE